MKFFPEKVAWQYTASQFFQMVLQSLKKKMEKNNSICALQADFALIFTGGN
jgi:hypothetical protein